MSIFSNEIIWVDPEWRSGAKIWLTTLEAMEANKLSYDLLKIISSCCDRSIKKTCKVEMAVGNIKEFSRRARHAILLHSSDAIISMIENGEYVPEFISEYKNG